MHSSLGRKKGLTRLRPSARTQPRSSPLALPCPDDSAVVDCGGSGGSRACDANDGCRLRVIGDSELLATPDMRRHLHMGYKVSAVVSGAVGAARAGPLLRQLEGSGRTIGSFSFVQGVAQVVGAVALREGPCFEPRSKRPEEGAVDSSSRSRRSVVWPCSRGRAAAVVLLRSAHWDTATRVCRSLYR